MDSTPTPKVGMMSLASWHCALLWLVIGSTNASFAKINEYGPPRCTSGNQSRCGGADPAGVVFLPHFATTDEVSEVRDQVQAKCSFVDTANHWAKDCKLPVATETVAKLAERLLATVIPQDCKFEAKELPVRQFDADVPEDELHSDAGPSWTVLVHLSDGATCFAESEDASKDGESGQCYLHSPGDVAIWWNNGFGPAHGTRLLPEASNKLVLNVGVFATSFSKCDGLHINSAGAGPPLSPIEMDFMPSHLEEVLFIGDPEAHGGRFDRGFDGWTFEGYHGMEDFGHHGVTYGKQVAYDAMCLAGVGFREGNKISAKYTLSPDYAGRSLQQIAYDCWVHGLERCTVAGQLYDAKGIDPASAGVLAVYDYGAVFAPVYMGMGDMPEPMDPEWAFGTDESLNPEAEHVVTIEGYPALELLFKGHANDPTFSNKYMGWFRKGSHLDDGYTSNFSSGSYYGSDMWMGYGKQEAYDSAPLYTIMFVDEYGRSAEYIINKDFAGLCLLEIVQKCMPDAWALRRNDGSDRWMKGHCEIGTLVAAKGLMNVSDQLRLGVGDLEAQDRIQYRDWALFMPLKGNGMGDFSQNVWAFGSKGATNSGANGTVKIYGGPSLACDTSLPPMCYPAGTRVMFDPESVDFAYGKKSCGTLESESCSGYWPRVNWDDGDNWDVNFYSLVECQALPGWEDADMVFGELLFAADGMDPEYKNKYDGWFEPMFSIPRRLDAGLDDFDDDDDSGPGMSGIQQETYWNMCLHGVRFSDDSGAYATYELLPDYTNKPLGQIVQECLPATRGGRRNVDDPAWHMGHCMVGDMTDSEGVAGVSEVLRIGVGDGMTSSDPNYPDVNDWAVFMPVQGNAEHEFWEPHGGGNFANGVWAFGSKGVTNSLHDGPVYIHGLPDYMPLFIATGSDPTYNFDFPGWFSSGFYGEDFYGKFPEFDTLPLSHIYLLDEKRNFAVYELEFSFGKTMLEIIQGCIMGGMCEVGSLKRFGGPDFISVSESLRMLVGDIEGGNVAGLTPLLGGDDGGDLEDNMFWGIGTANMTNPAVPYTTVAILGLGLNCGEI